MSYAAPGQTSNPFTKNLSDGVGQAAVIHHLSTKALLWGRFDVVHVHWPENLFRASGTVRNTIKTLCGVVFMLRLELFRTPIVYTKHNLTPHEQPGRLYGALYRWVERRVRATVFLNESSQNNPAAGVTILHGDYPPLGGTRRRHPGAEGEKTILFFGLLRRYKGLETLIGAFTSTADPTLRLRIRGSAVDRQYVSELTSLARADPRITFQPGFLDDPELERELASADLVVLPYVAIYNSGAALLALSRNRPILAPDGPSTRSLQAEVGESFVRLFGSSLSSEEITAAVDAQDPTPDGTPDLSRRDWGSIGALHNRLYELVSSNRRLAPEALEAAVRRGVAADRRFVEHSVRNTLIAGSDDAGI